MPRLLVVGNPRNRRITMLREAARDAGWTVEAASYLDLLEGRRELAPLAARADVVRLDSPGECFEVERRLLALGADEALREQALAARRGLEAAALPAGQAMRLSEELGRICFPRQYYLGFARLLRQWQRQLRKVRWMTRR